MTKYFCDGCGKELDWDNNVVAHRCKRQLQINGTKFQVEALVATDGCWNNGHLCVECLLRVINEGHQIA